MTAARFEMTDPAAAPAEAPQPEASKAPETPVVHAEPQQVTVSPPADVVTARNPFLPKISLNAPEDLPSQGKSYPPGYQLTYRSYTLGEIDQFENSQLSTRQQFELVLRGIECSFSPHDLTMSDVMYLGLLRRLASLGTNEIAVTSTCPNCGNANVSRVETSNLAFDDLQAPKLPVRVTLSDDQVYKFMPATIADYFKLLETGNKTNSLALLAVQCRSLEFPDSIQKISDRQHPDDILLLREIDRLLYHSIQPLSIDCKHELHIEGEQVPCGTRYRLRLENAAEAFILPFRNEGVDPKAKIQFGDE